jgi:acyl-CoA thioesterase II
MSSDFVPEVNPPVHQLAESSVTVERLDDDFFLAPRRLLYRPPHARGVYGGQVIGQALMAAASTVPPTVPLHSFHSYFILGGDADRDIVYVVNRLRDGKSFYTRSVVARQNGRAIFTLAAQFHHPEPSNGLEYRDLMPNVYRPGDLLDMGEYWREISDHPGLNRMLREYIQKNLDRPVVIDQKIVHRSLLRNDNRFREELVPQLWPLMVSDGKAERFIWMRSKGSLDHANSNIHKCVVAYMSDSNFITTALEPLHRDGARVKVGMTVSLDHSMWFHSKSVDLCADDWLLFRMNCHVTGGGRALLTAKVWNLDGDLVVTVAQEALIRLIDGSSKL